MNTTSQHLKETVQGLPADLRKLIGERALIESALDAVQAIGANLPRTNGMAARFSPPMLLTLLAYCYAAGIYSSEDIEWACRNDASARYICASNAPEDDIIRGFRRANRPWIEECLARVYADACGVKPMADSELQDETLAELIRFARRKVQLAILLDNAMRE